MPDKPKHNIEVFDAHWDCTCGTTGVGAKDVLNRAATRHLQEVNDAGDQSATFIDYNYHPEERTMT